MDPLRMLTIWADLDNRRPEFIRACRERGDTWDQIVEASGLSRRTVIDLSRKMGVQNPHTES